MSQVTLLPEDVSSLWINPDTSSTLTWSISGTPATTQPAADDYKYVILDYCDRQVVVGNASKTAEGKIAVDVKLLQGFYSIKFESLNQAFGIVAMARHTGKTDPFFCVDTAMSWLVGKANTTPTREGLIKVMSRIGIAMARERLGWNGTIQPEIDKWNWEGDCDYDSIRKCYAKYNIPILEMFHTCPDHIGRVIGSTPYRMPLDMLKVESSWSEMAKHWQSGWGALEIWNEIDGGFFSGNAPADQYAPLVKTIAYTFTRDGNKTPLVGGVVAYGWDAGFLYLAEKNGVLENVDVWSVHTYGHNSSLKFENFMQVYREAFKKYNVQQMPIWDTESGFAWTAKESRPPIDQDNASALELTMKAVEGLACGMERYFPFVMPYYAEEICNYSMTDKLGTPLRSIASYAWAIKSLGNREYIGDWKCDDPSIKRARVFGDKDSAVLVLFSGNILPIANVSSAVVEAPATSAKVDLPENAELYGIDGRRLTLQQDKKVPMPDGILYVVLKRADIDKFLNTNTVAMKLYKISKLPKIVRKKPSPIVLQFRPDTVKFYESDVKGYTPLADAPEKLPFPVDVTNLSDKPCELRIKLSGKKGQIGKEQVLTVAGQKTMRVEWTIDWNKDISLSPYSHDFTVVATNTDGTKADSIFLRLKGRPTLASWMKLFANKQVIPITELSRWTPSAIKGATMKMIAPDPSTWQLDVNFNGAHDRWVYPRFAIPNHLDMSKFKGIVFEGKCVSGALAVRTVLWEPQDDGGEITFMTGNILGSDNQWHPVFVPFANTDFGASGVDPNNKLRLARVRYMSFGMNSGAMENTLMIRNAWLVGD